MVSSDLACRRLDVDVSSSPGVVTLDSIQHYPSGATVKWPAPLTVLPGPEDEQSQSVRWSLIATIVGVGLIVTTGAATLGWRRR
jgi:hypothetical protein